VLSQPSANSIASIRRRRHETEFYARGIFVSPKGDWEIGISDEMVQLIDRKTERPLLNTTPSEGDEVTASCRKAAKPSSSCFITREEPLRMESLIRDGEWMKDAAAGQGTEKINEIVGRHRISQEHRRF
jgi:hypothetical protein